MIFALWVGANSLRGAPREPPIIPENPNQSKGLLASLVLSQAFERTGFFWFLPGERARFVLEVPQLGAASMVPR